MKRSQSFEDARRRRSRLLQAVRFFVILFAMYLASVTWAFRSVSAGSGMMSPTIERGDRIIVASAAYGFANPFGPGVLAPGSPQRGDVVLAYQPSYVSHGWYRRLVDALVRFVTFQRFSTLRSGPADAPMLARVVALPGDAVRMSGHVVQVKPAGEAHYLTEYEVSGVLYDIRGAGTPVPGWSASMPLSGNMEGQALGDDEYYLVVDNRAFSGDSRFFGPVPSRAILGKALFVYWPLNRLGLF